tara:strand:- start:1068 stop:1922 length:855 start_codon:yes stop_codon:yes gene_type:complete
MVEPEFQEVSTVPVGTDPLSQLSTKALESMTQFGGIAPTYLAGETQQRLRDIMANRGAGVAETTPFEAGVQENLQELLSRAGAFPEDQQRRAMEIEAARSPLDMLRQAQMEQGQAALASRNLLGQGPEIDYMQRMEQGLAPMYAQAGQQIELAEREAADQRYREALQLSQQMALAESQQQEARLSNAMTLATGMSQEQSRNLLDTVRTTTERQQMLSEIALRSLDQNMEWNRFLSEYGIKRDEAIEAIQTGRLTALMPLLEMYLKGALEARGGYLQSKAEEEQA